MAISFKARVLLELGAELISSDAVALYELVKNAIDASATSVRVDVSITLQPTVYRALMSWLDGLSPAKFDAAEFLSSLQEMIEPEAPEATKAAFWIALGTPATLAEATIGLKAAFFAGNSIRVADDGRGMSQETLQKGYLTVGTPMRLLEKSQSSSPTWATKSHETSTPVLGEKGIGRLAAMRLGHYVYVETAMESDKYLNLLELDWRPVFLDPTLDASALDFEPELGAKKVDEASCGTVLTIRELQSDWTHAKLRDLAQSELAKLSDPFNSDFINEFIQLSLQGTRVWLPDFDDSRFEYADAVCTATFGVKPSEDGTVPHKPKFEDLLLDITVDYTRFNEHRNWKVVGEHLMSSIREPVTARKNTKNKTYLPDSDAVLAALNRLGPFEMKFYWFNRGRLQKEQSDLWSGGLKDFVSRWSGGLLVYRDGFRVYPYGAPSDDWLDLDRNALSASAYKLNRAQIIGYLRISHEGNPALLDQTNREGFRDCPEKEALRRLLRHVIISKCRRYLEAIDKDAKKEAPETLETLSTRVSDAEHATVLQVRQLGKRVPQEQDAIQDILFQLGELHDAWDRAKATIKNHEDEMEQYVHLAGVGLQVEFVAHELARISQNALQLLNNGDERELASMRRGLEAQLKTLDKKIRTLDALSIPGRQRKKTSDIREIISAFMDMHEAKAQRHGIYFDVKYLTDASFEVTVEQGQVIQILDNLFSNSFYWLGARLNKAPDAKVAITVDPVGRTLEFRDNGPGVPPDMIDDIFRPFVTTKPDKDGRGLGLYISRRLAEYNDIVLSVGSPELDGNHHSFVLKFNTNKKEK
ncbi:sensor histidine kinase [Paraburkholderia sediminicola]|uniref:sensor histidine kinase n=1 Tax=Paraburkholderia sediminicola TaxID=458836 RepID=UPI0038BA470E